MNRRKSLPAQNSVLPGLERTRFRSEIAYDFQPPAALFFRSGKIGFATNPRFTSQLIFQPCIWHVEENRTQLTNVARASLGELHLDYRDFLRDRGLPEWERSDPRREKLVARRPTNAEQVAE